MMKRITALALTLLLALSLCACGLTDAAGNNPGQISGTITVECTVTDGKVKGLALRADAAEALGLMNAERAKAGLDPLTMDSAMNTTAALRAAESSVSFSHTRPDQSKCFTAFPEKTENTYRGEILGRGGSGAGDIVQSWMNSDGHKAKILNPEYNDVGIACVQVDGKNVWAACFTSAEIEPMDTEAVAQLAESGSEEGTWDIVS